MNSRYSLGVQKPTTRVPRGFKCSVKRLIVPLARRVTAFEEHDDPPPLPALFLPNSTAALSPACRAALLWSSGA